MFEESATGIVNAQAEECPVEQAQRDIYDSHRHRVFSLAFHMTGDELEAERLLTDSFVRAFQTDPKPDSCVIDNALIQGLRERFSLAAVAPASIAAAPRISDRNVRRTDLEEAIQELPPVERLAFLLRDVEGYSTDAIAQLINVPTAEVARTLFSARIRLRSILADIETERAA
jgi:RNA polymerase sigma-70 factor (ECF subfamily)